MKPLKILFFIGDSSPTAEEQLAAASINANVCYRNARYIDPKGALEACDAVAGAVPPSYRSLPSAAEALAKRTLELAAKVARLEGAGVATEPPPATAPTGTAPGPDAAAEAAGSAAVADWGAPPAAEKAKK